MTSSFLFPQKVKIKNILDTNLFELSDGKIIKLAGVDVPSLTNNNPALQLLAYDIYKYAEINLSGKKFVLIYPDTNLPNVNYSLVFIKRKYPFITLNFTQEYLKNGFGKFIKNISNIDLMKYKSAEEYAKQNKEGIWKLSNTFSDTLDKTFTAEVPLNINDRDSILTKYKNLPLLKRTSTGTIILLETIASPVFGMIGGILGGSAGSGLAELFGEKNWSVLSYVIIGASVSYLLGNSFGTYYIAQKNDRDVSYGYTLLSSFIGSVTGILLTTVIPDKNNIKVYVPLILPVLTSIIYANFIAPQKPLYAVETAYNEFRLNQKEYFTHSDLYNSTKYIEVSLFKINF